MAQTDVRIVNERLQALLLQRAVDEWQTSRNRVVEDDATDCGVDNASHVVLNNCPQDVLRIVFLDQIYQVAHDAQLDRRLCGNFAGIECEQHFLKRSKHPALALCTGAIASQAVNTEHEDRKSTR